MEPPRRKEGASDLEAFLLLGLLDAPSSLASLQAPVVAMRHCKPAPRRRWGTGSRASSATQLSCDTLLCLDAHGAQPPCAQQPGYCLAWAATAEATRGSQATHAAFQASSFPGLCHPSVYLHTSQRAQLPTGWSHLVLLTVPALGASRSSHLPNQAPDGLRGRWVRD